MLCLWKRFGLDKFGVKFAQVFSPRICVKGEGRMCEHLESREGKTRLLFLAQVRQAQKHTGSDAAHVGERVVVAL